MLIVNELPQTGADDTIYLVPNSDPQTDNKYDEYIYKNNEWEKLGGVEVQVDLTDYVKNTDYASSSKGGVIKTGYQSSLNSSGVLKCDTFGYENYSNASSNSFISKGTLENVITGKGLVSNTDYTNGSTGGVIKVSSSYGTGVSNTGFLQGAVRTYEQYGDAGNAILISKGTLENVLTARIGTIETALETLDTGSGV